jgi:hypothetical protein
MENAKAQGTKRKILALSLTTLVISLLILAGPVHAFSISLNNFSDSTPIKGDKITINAEIEIRIDEVMPLPNPIEVYIDNLLICTFSVDLNSTTCNLNSNGIDVSLLSSTTSITNKTGYAYGYGYGYGYQEGHTNGLFSYQLRIDTDKFTTGTHKLQLLVNTKLNPQTQTYNSEKKSFTSRTPSHSGGRSYSDEDDDTISFRMADIQLNPDLKITDSKQDNQNTTTLNNESNQKKTSSLAAITGAAIGVFGQNSNLLILSLIISIILLLFLILIARRRKTRRKRIIRKFKAKNPHNGMKIFFLVMALLVLILTQTYVLNSILILI